MNKFSKKEFSENFSPLQYATDAQESWDCVAKSVTEYAKVLQQKRIKNGESGSALSDWWNSCVELLLNHQIVINDLNFDGSRNNGQNEEYIEILNKGPLSVDLSDWKINAGNEGQDMKFGKGTVIHPNSMLRVYTDKAGELSFNSKQSVWNNKGDRAFLYDANGQLICSWSYGVKAHSDVAITYICFNGKEKRTEADEYVEVVNFGSNLIDLSNWQLSAGKQQKFNFPEKSVLKPYAKIRVYTNLTDTQSGGYSFNSHTAVWNNKGDTGVLNDNRGLIVSEYSYG